MVNETLLWGAIATALMSILEDEVVPEFYARDQRGNGTGFVKNAGLLPSMRCPSHASPNASGISSKPMIQWYHTTIKDENPTGIAIMWSARFTGWLCALS